MNDFYRFGRETREFLSGLLAITTPGQQSTGSTAAQCPTGDRSGDFEESFFFGELNRFMGSGGEILVKGSQNTSAPPTRIDVGDRLIGIGVTHLVESLSRPPGLDSFRAFASSASSPAKSALRAFEVTGKERREDGFHFDLSALSPTDYSALVSQVSGGAVNIPANTIPPGTMIISFTDRNPTYTLAKTQTGTASNWERATKGDRHWNVGIGCSSDFWEAEFPADDIGILTQVPPTVRVGTIRFGLSLLSGSRTQTSFKPVTFARSNGQSSSHQFCLSGYVVGTQGLATLFPIGLRTEILFEPHR